VSSLSPELSPHLTARIRRIPRSLASTTRSANCRKKAEKNSRGEHATGPRGHYECFPDSLPAHDLTPRPRIEHRSAPLKRRQTRLRMNRPAHAQDPPAQRHRLPVEGQWNGARRPRPDAAGEPGVRVERVQREPPAPPAAQARI